MSTIFSCSPMFGACTALKASIQTFIVCSSPSILARSARPAVLYG